MAHSPRAHPLSFDDEEDLTDEQVAGLLKEAEGRLRLRHEVAQKTQAHMLRKSLPKLSHDLGRSSIIKEKDGIAAVDAAQLVDPGHRKLADTPWVAEPTMKLKKTNDALSAGSDWFHLPKTVLTPQLKRDFQLLDMRSVLDPHRHYKKDDRKGKVPTFSQVGTVIQGPTEWYSARINKKDRAKNFVEETMTTEQSSSRFRRKYNEIQASKTSGKKAHYKALLAKRKRKS